MELKYKVVTERNASDGPVPKLEKAYSGDAGFDLVNASLETIFIPPYESRMIPAGIAVKIPENHCGIIMGRSSTFQRRGILVVNGLIDAGFTGPLFTIAYNPCLNGNEVPVMVRPGERISQLVIHDIPSLDVVKTDDLGETERGENGFGSSGV